MRINDLPVNEKPRERLVRYGASNLSNEDLLAIIFRTGTKECNVKVLSNELLMKVKSISNLGSLGLNELQQIKGLGKVKAITLLAAIELGKRVSNKEINELMVVNNTEVVHRHFAPLISGKKQEELLVILLDHKKRLISYQIMYKGTVNELLTSPQEIFYYAIKEGAAGLILMHNHPSGMINPSAEDLALTNKIISGGELLGIKLLDHLITNGESYYSFFEEMVKCEN